MACSASAPLACARTRTARLGMGSPPPSVSWQPNTKPYPGGDEVEKEGSRAVPCDMVLDITK